MKNVLRGALIAGAVIILGTCLSPYDGGVAEAGLPGTKTPIAESDLFVQQGGGGSVYRFYTDDPKYRTPLGYTLWAYSSGPGALVERAVKVRKTYGSAAAGYGLVICSAERLVGGAAENVFLTVLINNSKEYAVGKVTGSLYTPLVKWTKSGGLDEGRGLWNTIRIERDAVDHNAYHLFFNTIKETVFFDDKEPKCEGTGRNGYIAVIAPNDLNNSSVEAWFDETP